MPQQTLADSLPAECSSPALIAGATRERRPSAGHKRWPARILLVPLTFLSLLPGLAFGGGGPLGIDSELPLDTGGIWARKYQTGIENGVIVVEVAGALWFGNDDKLGHTFWQDIDSTALSGVAAELLKYGFSRPRPYQGDNPNAWFKGSCCQSFPSGEVTLQAAFVTPIIVNYYKQDPWIWALEALPVYDAIARLKSQAHWQTDVIAGGLIGTAFGYWATTRQTPLSVQIVPRGVSIGISKRF
jgi:membrane-associated phospholipid phosphatase